MASSSRHSGTIGIIISIILTIISIHAFLSNRTKQAGQTAKHASVLSHVLVQYVSEQTTQAGQTAIAIAQYMWKATKPATLAKTTAGKPFSQKQANGLPLWRWFAPSHFGCSRTPFKFKFKSPLPWQFALSSFGCSTSPFKLLVDDCSPSPSIIPQCQTEANLPL
jgi:hypothetical protein